MKVGISCLVKIFFTGSWTINVPVLLGNTFFIYYSRSKSLSFEATKSSQLSAIVEPIAGVFGAVAIIYMQPVLPFALAFAAGAMMYVVVEEVIPETQRDKYTDIAVLGFIGGFVIMMILDVALG